MLSFNIKKEDRIGKEYYEDMLTRVVLTMKLKEAGVEIRTGMTLKGYSGKKVICRDKRGNTVPIEADSAVLAVGLEPRTDMAAQFEGLAPQVFKVGNCVQANKIYSAFESAWHAVFSF